MPIGNIQRGIIWRNEQRERKKAIRGSGATESSAGRTQAGEEGE